MMGYFSYCPLCVPRPNISEEIDQIQMEIETNRLRNQLQKFQDELKEKNPMSTPRTQGDRIQIHSDICERLHELYVKKNHDYGDSFHKTFLEEGYAMTRIRLADKFERFKTLSRGEKQKVSDESLEDTLIDLANYAIMTIVEMRRLDESI